MEPEILKEIRGENFAIRVSKRIPPGIKNDITVKSIVLNIGR